ncbi:DMT family transporter [Actinotalea sp. M2MS4P-6]|uniref:DMT family transporter n=1 Tax=Actinotalea sp. M2MS4P-6 TaxID=2983762 RepID=UPI0021E4FBE9|nr:DMT family transporter [Actinotalea sp. M2MS4P-6]MCV2393669.1 DMT family transporter [Actinotalea sp. M2MS4P-6]
MTSGRPTTSQVAPGVVVAALIGVLIAAQTRLNGDLAVAGAGTLLAGWISYLGTLATIAVLIAVRGRTARTARTMRERGRWWWYAIGLCGIPIVLGSAYGVPIVGVAIASVASVAGQTVAGLVLDARGVGVPVRLPLTGRRAAAALTALGGLGLAMVAGSGVGAAQAVAIGALLFVGGAALAVQSAGNGAVARDSGDSSIAGLASATGGTVGISALVVVGMLTGALASTSVPTDAGSWYLYLGGPLGAGIVVAAAWAVRRLGTFALTLTVVGGQLVAALVVDLSRGMGVPWTTSASVVAIVVATTLGITPRPALARAR